MDTETNGSGDTSSNTNQTATKHHRTSNPDITVQMTVLFAVLGGLSTITYDPSIAIQAMTILGGVGWILGAILSL